MNSNLHSTYKTFLDSKLKIIIFFAFSFVLFALIISTIAFFISYKYEENYLEKKIKNDAYIFISNKEDYLNSVINRHKKNILAIVNNQIFIDYIEKNNSKQYVENLFEQNIKSHDDMMQLRYLDQTGKEIIRLERTEQSEEYKIVHENFLQDKSQRYYFTHTAQITVPNQVWISDLDLNIENKKVQIPYVPTLRISVPVFFKDQFKGIVIVNLFMKKTLKDFTKSQNFMVSLVDQNGDFLIGTNEHSGSIVDYSWSKYRDDKNKLSQYFPKELSEVLNSQKFNTHTLFSKKILQSSMLPQNLTMIVQVKQNTLEEIRSNTKQKIYDTLSLVLFISGPLGLLLSLIPSSLASRVIRASDELKNKSLIFDEYLEAMNVNNIISKSNDKGIITYVNDNFCKVSGYTRKELLGKPHSLLRDPSIPKETFKILWLTIQSGKIWKGILRNRKKDGGFYDIDMVVMPIKDSNDKIIEFLAVRHDITELIEQRKNLLDIANTDQLTFVGNRYKLNNDIKEHIVNNIAVIDIDKFSNINDLYGHNIGDFIIQEFSKLLEHNLTNEFSLYRLHADKFAVLNYTLDKERFANYIDHLNTKMVESVIQTQIKDFDIVTTSGISSQENTILLTTAEIANKHAKSIGKKVLSYSKELNLEKKFEENIKRTEEIKLALSNDRFVVYFQPIFNNKTNTIEKYETLIRMIDQEGNVIAPFFFLDIAKSNGQYIDITKIVIQQSFKKFSQLDVEFSINLTIEDILDNEITVYLEDILQEYNVAHKLVIEIVESESIKEFEIVQKFMKRLKSFGVKFAIDDFGTGYSNFEYLIKLDIDYIKIDGSLIKDLPNDKNMELIVTTIVEFAKKMNYKIIAEFVSDDVIFEMIKQLDIDYSQGFFIGKPQQELI